MSTHSYEEQQSDDKLTSAKFNEVTMAIGRATDVGFFPAQDADHIIFEDKGVYYARNGKTGELEFSDKDANIVIQSVQKVLTIGRTWKETIAIKGYFPLRDSINVESHTLLDLRGASLRLDNAVHKSIIQNIDLSGNTDIDIVGGVLDGNKAYQTEVPQITAIIHGVKLLRCSDCSVVGVHIKNVYTNGISLYPTTCRCKILGNTLEGCGINAIVAENASQNNIISGNVINGVDVEHGIVLSNDSSFNNVVGNVILNTGKSGIVISPHDSHPSTNNVIKGNIIKNPRYHGIVSLTESGVGNHANIVIGNQIHSSGLYGIVFDATKRDTIQSNQIVSSNCDGVRIINGSKVVVNGNTCVNNSRTRAGTYHGIIVNNSIDCIVEGNICYDDQSPKTQGFGICESGTSNYNIIIGNHLKDNLIKGMSTVGTHDEIGYNIQ